jgi:RNA polymerase sigma-70 factor (ECF subfamily)
LPRKPTAKAYLDLVAPLRDVLYRHARRTVWNAALVDDVIQETLLIAWREFTRYEPGTNFRAWVFRILVNVTFKFNKQEARRHEVALPDSATDLFAAIEREEAWVRLLERPEMLMQLLDGRLTRALQRLGEHERQCLLLRLLEEFTYKDIASMVEIPVGTVMSHVHRARIKLRERLAELAVEQGLIKESAR